MEPNRGQRAKEKPSLSAGLSLVSKLELRDLDHVPGLWTLLTFDNFELNGVPLLEAFITIRLDCTVMNEHIGTIFPADESESFCIVEPLNGSSQTRHVLFPPCDLRMEQWALHRSCIHQVC